MKYGIAMDGMEDALGKLIAKVRARFHPFTYLEIGVASCETLAAVSLEISRHGFGWRSAGIDLPDGYLLDKDDVQPNALTQHLFAAVMQPNGSHEIDPVWHQITLFLGDSRDLIPDCWHQPVHLALIDACHCKACVTTDFLSIERHVQPGGVVMFHDFAP